MRSGAGVSSPNPNTKKDPNAVPQTPLERLLSGAGPIRDDGSDKFWGLENFGNTCVYIIRHLFEKEHELQGIQPTTQTPVSPLKPKTPNNGTSARNPGGPAQSPKPEDKESPEAKKKAAIALGPSLSLNYENTEAYGMPETLFTAMKDIFEALLAHQSRIGVLSPHKFLEVLRRENEMFRTSMHQDAHEFLNLLLNEVIANVEAEAKEKKSKQK
ncbi:ubiquitin carboxyl-terminal hydrolase creB [Physcia stellaris]|nr:ubiquitin carboxyl-terminal hydrolase creB [Physcia stellaris]